MGKLKLIISLISVFVLGACSDFLKEKSQDEVIVKTVEDYNELLLGYTSGNLSDILYILDDDVQIIEDLLPSSSNSSSDLGEYYRSFTWQPDMWEYDDRLEDNYQSTYSLIMGINAVLDGIDEAVGQEENKERIKAEALATRAFYYHMLVNMYGEPYNCNKKALGIPLKLNAGLVENGVARNTVEEVYDQIVKDLEMAVSLFEKYPKGLRGNYRMNICVANILLSRVYLYMEQWENVIKTATRAIETAEGLTDYTKLSEFYMATYDNSEVEWIYGHNLFGYLFGVSDDLLSKYGEGDSRVTFWFRSNRLVLKNEKIPTISNPQAPNQTIRISEAYLNRAEAYVQAGEPDKAMSDLNELRRHRIVDYEDKATQDIVDLLEEVRLERRLEFCFEMQRWFDLRRYGMPLIYHDYKDNKNASWMRFTLKEKDPLYTLPIPTLMMQNNVRLEQNTSFYEPARMGITQ